MKGIQGVMDRPIVSICRYCGKKEWEKRPPNGHGCQFIQVYADSVEIINECLISVEAVDYVPMRYTLYKRPAK